MWHKHPQRESGEVMGSWIFRVARAMNKPPGALVDAISPDRVGHARDIDRFPKPEFIHEFAVGVGVSEDDVIDATFWSWDVALGNLTDRTRSGGNARWHLRYAKLPNRSGGSCGMQYCRECLRGPISYFRKVWRESFVTLCPVHNVQLLDTCSACESPAFYRGTLAASQGDIARASLDTCLNCGVPLTVLSNSSVGADPVLHEFQRRLVEGLDTLQISLGSVQVNAATVFQLMEKIILSLWRAHYSDQHRSHLQDLSGITVPMIPARPNYSFDLAPIAIRAPMMQAIAFLLAEWPKNFVAFHEIAGKSGAMYWAQRSPILAPTLRLAPHPPSS
jgi:hypothetical protein